MRPIPSALAAVMQLRSRSCLESREPLPSLCDFAQVLPLLSAQHALCLVNSFHPSSLGSAGADGVARLFLTSPPCVGPAPRVALC